MVLNFAGIYFGDLGERVFRKYEKRALKFAIQAFSTSFCL